MKTIKGRELLPENEKLKGRPCRLNDNEYAVALALARLHRVRGLGALVRFYINQDAPNLKPKRLMASTGNGN